jgi:hypothetical protein
MSYSRQPLLSKQQEDELKSKMEPLWNQVEPKLTGMEIAKQLKFGQPNSDFAVLKPCYVYFYRQKFNLPLRAEAKFKKHGVDVPEHRYKFSPKELKLMSPETFVATLNETLPKTIINSAGVEVKNIFAEPQRCFLITLFQTPLRASEIYERVQNMPLDSGKAKNDFEILDNKIIIHLLRKKKRFHKEADEPISIRRDFPLVEEIAEYLQSKSWEKTFNGKPNKVKKKDAYGVPIKSHGAYQFELNHRPFNISKTCADNWVKSVFGDEFYCHYFRFCYVTSATKIPGMKVSELRAKTYLTLSALETYIFTPEMTEDEFDAKKAIELKKGGGDEVNATT